MADIISSPCVYILSHAHLQDFLSADPRGPYCIPDTQFPSVPLVTPVRLRILSYLPESLLDLNAHRSATCPLEFL